MDDTKAPVFPGTGDGMLAGWPHLTVSWCPYCEEEIANPILTRWRADAGTAEYRCPNPGCGMCHVRDRGDVDQVRYFYLDDIEAMLLQESQLSSGADWRQQWADEQATKLTVDPPLEEAEPCDGEGG
jgi:hypothetical protein